MKKTIFLFLILIIPGSVFLFLKYFGTNIYEVPILFEEGIHGCPDSRAPHRVRLSGYIGETNKNIAQDLHGFIVIGVLDVSSPESNIDRVRELVRIQDAFYEIGSPYFVLFPYGNPGDSHALVTLCAEIGLDQKNYRIVNLREDQLIEFLQCEIALIDQDTREFNNLVLVDPEKRIRGIYDSMDVEQTEKLILELKILKKKM